MAQPLTGIDHPVIAVRDMAEAYAVYTRLGFTIPPRGSHIEWGTGNWCIMFPRDYLELRGIVDPARYTHNLDRFLAEREGLMGIAFATEDAEASCRMLQERGIGAAPPRELTRNFELPEGNVQPRFRLCFPDEADTPGLMSVVFCQHLTPELIRRPEWLRHPNGAVGVRSITAVVPDIPAVQPAYERLFGAAALHRDSERLTVRLDGHRIDVVTPSGLATLHPGAAYDAAPRPPYLAAVAVAVADPDAAAAHLAQVGVPAARGAAGTVRIAPRDACGLILEFAAAA